MLVRIAYSFFSPPIPPVFPTGEAVIRGVVTQEPRNNSRTQIFTLADIEIIKARYPEVNYGDRVEIKGKVTKEKKNKKKD